MPSEKPRKKTKDDTWGAEELGKSIKDAMREDSAKKPRSREKDKERRKDRDSKDKEREHRKDRDKDHQKDREKDRDRKDRDKEKDKDREHRKDRDKERDREGRKDRDKDKEPRKDKDREHRDKDREHRKDRDKDKDRERRREKERTDDGHRDEERRRDKDRDKNDSDRKDRKDKERRHRDKEETNGERKHRRDDSAKEGKSDPDKRKEEERRRRKKEEGKKEETKEERRERKERERKKKEEEEKKGSGKHRESKEDSDKSHRSEEKRSSRHETKEDHIEDEIIEDNNNGKEDAGNNYEDAYEDDFEDYDDDDFEDEDDEEEDDSNKDDNSLMRESSAELDEIRRAMASENQATLRSSRSSKEPSSSANSSRTSARSSRSTINFVAAKQRQMDTKVWKHSQKRGQELMKLIELDVVNYDLFEMAPVKEYELYIKSFGRSDTKQAFVQCNDDNLDRDIQTDPIENREMWTQHPAEGVAASGGAGVKTDDDIFNEADSLRLTKFLQKAGQAVNILLEEELSESASGTLKSNQRSIVFSEGYTQLNSQLSFLEGRHVIQAQFHPVQTNLLLTVHSMCKKDSDNVLSRRGLLCVWNINEPSRPQKILSCKSTPTCCCFSPTKSTFAFAGSVDGTVVVWDLREPAKMHQTHTLSDGEWTIRVPTFSTDGIQSNDSHHSGVVTVQPIVAAEESLKASMQSSRTTDDMSGLSFQLASLEEKGVIHFSVVIEIDKPDQAGSESDLGLVPCGKIKLIKTSSVSLVNPSRGLGVTTMKTFHMQLSPMDPNQFFVSTDSGNILHGARHGGRIPPQTYRDKLEIPMDIVQIDFSPFGLPVFLAACDDGSIRLYNIHSDIPLITWNNSTNGLGICCIQWSRSRASVFYVMDKASKVYVWELLENDGAPVKTEQFTHASLTYMTLSNDHLRSAGRGQLGKRPEMLVTDAKGAMDVHRINEKFSTAGPSELDDVNDLFHNMI